MSVIDNFSFRKNERISGRAHFEKLIREGKSFNIFPFRVVWMPIEEKTDYPAQVAFAVPKRNVKGAVKRNKIKRQLREAYRLNKPVFYNDLEKRKLRLRVLMIFNAREVPTQKEAVGKIILTLHRLLKETDAAGRNSIQA
jgi:ribonuclease P protein component